MKVWRASFEWWALCKSLQQRSACASILLSSDSPTSPLSALPAYWCPRTWHFKVLQKYEGRTDKEKTTWISMFTVLLAIANGKSKPSWAEPISKRTHGKVWLCVSNSGVPKHGARQNMPKENDPGLLRARKGPSIDLCENAAHWPNVNLTAVRPRLQNMLDQHLSNLLILLDTFVVNAFACVRSPLPCHSQNNESIFLWNTVRSWPHSKKGKWPVKVAYGSRLWNAEIEQPHSTDLYLFHQTWPYVRTFPVLRLVSVVQSWCWKLK